MENSINEVYQLDIVVLTPLHAGAGSEKDLVKGLDYVQKDGQVYLLNQKKVLQEIDISTLSNMLLNRDDSQLIIKLSGKLDKVSDTVYEMPVTSDNDIKAFLKSGMDNKPVLPGSSIKGAIRSILFAYLKNEGQDKENAVFGNPNTGDEFMRFIKVSDAAFNRLTLSNTKIFNLTDKTGNWEGAWKHGGNLTDTKFKSTGFNTLYEVLPPEAYSKITLSLADKAFNNFSKFNHQKFGSKKEDIINKPIELLFRIVNQHTTDYIKKEIAFFTKYSNNETDSIIESFKSVLGQIPDDNSWCVLKMSAGSGFHSITGDWQFDDYTNQPGLWTSGRNQGKKKFKSRKIAIGNTTDNFRFAPMGFVKIGRKSEEELEQERLKFETKLEFERKEAAERKRRQVQEEADRREALLKEQAEIQRLESERLQKETEAKQLEAERLEGERLKREADEKARLERLAQKVEGGLSFLATSRDFDDSKKRIDDWIKKAKVEILPESQHQYLQNAITRFYNELKLKEQKKWAEPFAKNPIWKKISGWIGPDLANEWYNKIIK